MPEVTPKAYAQLLSIAWQNDDLPLWSLKIRDGYQRRLGFSEMSNAKKDPSLITIMLVGVPANGSEKYCASLFFPQITRISCCYLYLY